MESFVLPRQIAVVVVAFGVSCLCVCVLFGYNKIKWMFSRVFFCYIFWLQNRASALHIKTYHKPWSYFFSPGLSWLHRICFFLLRCICIQFEVAAMANGNGYTSHHHVVGGGPDIQPSQFVRLAGWLFDSHLLCLSVPKNGNRQNGRKRNRNRNIHAFMDKTKRKLYK